MLSTPSCSVPYCHNVDDSFYKLGQALAGKILQSIFKLVLACSWWLARQNFVQGCWFDRQRKWLCLKKGNLSPFTFQEDTNREADKWSSCIDELKGKFPILLSACAIKNYKQQWPSQSAKERRVASSGNMYSNRSAFEWVEYKEMGGIQRMLSLVLFTSHVQKQVLHVHVQTTTV